MELGCWADFLGKHISITFFADYIFYGVWDKKEKTELSGHIGENTATAIENGEETTVSIPPDESNKFFLDWGLAALYWDNIRSFYQNFYEPFFGNRQEQVRQMCQ